MNARALGYIGITYVRLTPGRCVPRTPCRRGALVPWRALHSHSDLPRLFGSDWFTRRTLRFVWHLTTVVCWGLAAVLVVAASTSGPGFREAVLLAIAGTFLASAILAGGFTNGRHLSWIVLLAISVLIFAASR